MGYERNERRYWPDRGYGNYAESERGRSYGGWDRWNDDRARSYGDYGNYGGRSYARDYRGDRLNDRSDDYRSGGARWPDSERGSGGYDDRDRGFFERAGDEVRSWFGDEEAERRRREDMRYNRYSDRGYEDTGYSYGSYRSRYEHDPHYRNWRDRQMEALDRDYEEYRRENQTRFDGEFRSWRQQRLSQRELLQRVNEHQEVVGSDGEHIGTVDKVRGDRILLTRSDANAGGHHHSIPCSWLTSVEDKVVVNKTADQARQHWRDEERGSSGGLFGRDSDEDREVNLNRSFSGTY